MAMAAMQRDKHEAGNVADYQLHDQVGFILRMATQRHTSLFADRICGNLTPTQFAVLAKLYEKGSISQNELGRQTAMDIATVKGVVDRLRGRGLTQTRNHPGDGRRRLVALTAEGRVLIRRAILHAFDITEATLAPLNKRERASFLKLLQRLT